MLIIAIYILVFLFLSGLLAMVDAAILSVSYAEVEELILHRKPGAGILKKVKERITQAVVVIVMVTNTINVLGPILVGQKAVEIYDNNAIGVITAILTFGTIIFSEIIPKSLGTHYAPIIARVSAPAVLWLSWILYPIVFVLEKIAAFFQRGERQIGTEAQIRSLVSIGMKAGRIEDDEGQMIEQAFILNDRSAKDIMTPIQEVVSLPQNSNVADAVRVVVQHEYSRYPVLNGKHQVIGIVMSREILRAAAEDQHDYSIEKFIQSIPQVSADERSDSLLAIFRHRHIHLATVHENETLIGIVTLEDVLEELVGEIEDEKDG